MKDEELADLGHEGRYVTIGELVELVVAVALYAARLSITIERYVPTMKTLKKSARKRHRTYPTERRAVEVRGGRDLAPRFLTVMLVFTWKKVIILCSLDTEETLYTRHSH